MEVSISAPVTFLQHLRRHLRRAIDSVARVIQIPVRVQDTPGFQHSFVERRARVRRQYVERRRLDALLNGPLDRALEHRLVISVHAEDEAAVDHHALLVQATDSRTVIPPKVLRLALLAKVLGTERLEPDRETAQGARDK